MAKPSVSDVVRAVLVEQLGVGEDEVTVSAKIVYDLGADSLDVVELMMAFEEEFDLEIPDKDVESIVTVQDAIDYLEKRVEKKK